MGELIFALLGLGFGVLIARCWDGVHYSEGYDDGYGCALEDREWREDESR